MALDYWIFNKGQETNDIDRPLDTHSIIGAHQSLEPSIGSGVVVAHNDHLDIAFGEGRVEDLEKAFTVDVQTFDEKDIGQITIPKAPQFANSFS